MDVCPLDIVVVFGYSVLWGLFIDFWDVSPGFNLGLISVFVSGFALRFISAISSAIFCFLALFGD